MINKYRRAARTAEELNLGELAPLDAAIPELAQAPDTNGGSSPTSNGDPVDASGTEAETCAQECAHADLDVANREVDLAETAENSDVSPPSGASLNPLIMVRIHAPEPAFLSDRLDARNKVRNNSERWPRAAAGEVAVPRAVTVADAVTPAAVSASIRADMGRALAEGLARALAVGDKKTARIALAALSALMDDAPAGASG